VFIDGKAKKAYLNNSPNSRLP